MGGQIAGAYTIGLVLDSVLRDQDRKTEAPGPDQRLPEASRPIGDESRGAQIRAGRVNAPSEKLGAGAEIEGHGFACVVVQPEEILGAGRLADDFTAEGKSQAAVVDGQWDQIVVDTRSNAGQESFERVPGVERTHPAVVVRQSDLGLRLNLMDRVIRHGVGQYQIAHHP